jgi:hypothetical protein
MSNLTCSGTVLEGPAQQSDPQFPSGVTTIPFTLNQGTNPKPVNVSTGAKVRNLNSPAAFVALSGVGASDDVTQASFVYLRVAQGSFQFRVTFHNPLGASIVSIVPSAGICVLEPDAVGGYYVTLIEAMGSGLVEYYAAGTQ